MFSRNSILFLLQRADAAALSHDHGADITAASVLTGIHSLLCFDHEMDRTVNAGIESSTFGPILHKASNLVNIIRNSPNLYRVVKDDNVIIYCLVCSLG